MRALFRNFDLVAAAYPLLETMSFGNSLNEARRAFVQRTATATHVLLIGEGNGRFLCELLARKRGGTVTVVDQSPRMLRLLSRRVSSIRRYTELKLITADFLAWNADGLTYDAVVTHFFLDLFRTESQLLVTHKISHVAKPGAIWVNVDYRLTKPRPLHRLIDWLQYRFDRTFSGIEADRLYDSSEHIRSAGWLIDEERLFCSGAVAAQSLTRVQ